MTVVHERLHSLDSLRAIMMLLGLVIHTAISYGQFDYGEAWPIKDVVSSGFSFDMIVFYIHTFRMPVFFVISGFFGAFIFFEKSPLAMLKNRMVRILLPFIVFMVLLWPIIVFVWVYCLSIMAGGTAPVTEAWNVMKNGTTYVPTNTVHLWFLYYLIFFSLLGWCLGFLQTQFALTANTVKIGLEWLLKNSLLRVLILTSLTFGILMLMKNPWPEKSGGFIPDFKPFLNYFVFYIFGWLLYGSKHLLQDFSKNCWPLFIAGTSVFLIRLFNYPSFSMAGNAAANAFIAWSLIFAFIGLFMRYLNHYSKSMRYISDASYWIFLVHLPLTALGAGLLMGVDLPAFVKFLIILITASLLCLFSYKYCVRNTFIGQFLNGKRHEE